MLEGWCRAEGLLACRTFTRVGCAVLQDTQDTQDQQDQQDEGGARESLRGGVAVVLRRLVGDGAPPAGRGRVRMMVSRWRAKRGLLQV